MAQQLSGGASENKFCRCEVWFLNRTHKIFFFLPSWWEKVSLTPLFLYQIQIFSIFHTAYTHLSLIVHLRLLTLVCLQTVPWTDPESGLIHLVSPGILCHDTSETKNKKNCNQDAENDERELKKINPYHCSIKAWLCNFANCYLHSQIHNPDCKNITDHFSQCDYICSIVIVFLIYFWGSIHYGYNFLQHVACRRQPMVINKAHNILTTCINWLRNKSLKYKSTCT